MLNTIIATVPISSKPPLASLKITDTYSLSSINKSPFQTDTNLIATSYPSQTLF